MEILIFALCFAFVFSCIMWYWFVFVILTLGLTNELRISFECVFTFVELDAVLN